MMTEDSQSVRRGPHSPRSGAIHGATPFSRAHPESPSGLPRD
jgi:hypothetical protein